MLLLVEAKRADYQIVMGRTTWITIVSHRP